MTETFSEGRVLAKQAKNAKKLCEECSEAASWQIRHFVLEQFRNIKTQSRSRSRNYYIISVESWRLEVKKSKISVVSCWLLVDGENSSVIFKENLLLKNNK